MLPAISQGQAAPVFFEEWSESTPLAFEDRIERHEAQRAQPRVANKPLSTLDRIGPEPELPEFPYSMKLQTPFEPRLEWDDPNNGMKLPEVGPILSPDQLFTDGYDGLIDGYTHRLLQGDDLAFDRTSTNCGVCPSTGLIRTGWYAQVQMLLLNPVERSQETVSRDATGLAVLGTSSLEIDWSAGVEGRLGFRTSNSAVEFGWWTLFAASDAKSLTSPTSDLVSAINFNGIGVPFGPAQQHGIERELEVQSFDVRYIMAKTQPGSMQYGFWWGLRFFRLRDVFRFESDLSLTVSLDDILYQVDVDNRLFGPNLGGIARWQLAPRLALHCEVQTGVYYNDIDERQAATNELGTATFNTGPNAGRPFDFDVNDAVVSILAGCDIGLEYEVNERIRLLAGYRILAAAGVARATSQIPKQLGPIDQVEIDAGGSLLLHGFELGFDFWF